MVIFFAGWAIAVLAIGLEIASLRRRVCRLEEKREEPRGREPCPMRETKPDRLFCEWMYGGEE